MNFCSNFGVLKPASSVPVSEARRQLYGILAACIPATPRTTSLVFQALTLSSAVCQTVFSLGDINSFVFGSQCQTLQPKVSGARGSGWLALALFHSTL